MHLWDFRRAGIHIWDFWMKQSIWVCTCVATGKQSNKCFDKIFSVRIWNLFQYWFGKGSLALRFADMEFRYASMDFFKTPQIQYEFWEKTQYLNMNFWCFLVTPVFGQNSWILGKRSIEKKTFSFRHCPNYLRDAVIYVLAEFVR